MSERSAAGRLYGVGLGPGDPELLTVKAVRIIQCAPVIAYFAKAGRRGHARKIVDRWMPSPCAELPLYATLRNSPRSTNQAPTR
jgi:precorrin-2/cobalt-factor-2 C20-methyltransferase